MSGQHNKRVTNESVEEMVAGFIPDDSAQCEGLCEEIRTLSNELQNAIGKRRVQIAATIRAVQAQRTALRCPTCLLM